MGKNERLIVWSAIIVIALFCLYQYSQNEMNQRSRNWTKEQWDEYYTHGTDENEYDYQSRIK